jgi:hypothetical protein
MATLNPTGELYWGHARVPGFAGTPAPAGFVTNSDVNGNPEMYSTTVTGMVSPTLQQSAGTSLVISVLVSDVRSMIKAVSQASGNLATCVLPATPTIGDLMMVWIGMDTPMTIHPPTNYATGLADSWVPVYGGQGYQDARLWCFMKTANATDATQTSFTFNFLPMLDTSQAGLPQYATTDFVATLVTYQSSSSGAAGLDMSAAQSYPNDPGLRNYNLPLINSTGGLSDKFVSAVFSLTENAGSSFPAYTHSDPATSLTQSVTFSGGNQHTLALSVYLGMSGTTYPYQISSSRQGAEVVTSSHGLRNVPTGSSWYYRTPFVREGFPYEGDDQMLIRRISFHQQYTVLNNAGSFTAGRFFSQDQLAAATQVFTQTQLVSDTDRTNLLTTGVGGDFMIGTRNGC